MQNDSINPEQRAGMIGEIILEARSIESKLHAICKCEEVTGLHALTELLAHKLPGELKNQLHYIATIRNHAAHEESFVQSNEEFRRFRQCAAEVKSALDRLFPVEEQSPDKTDTAAEWENRMAVERELFAQMARQLSALGFIPVLGNIYLLYILLVVIFSQGFLVLLTMLYACSVVLGFEGWHSADNRGLLYVGAGAFAFTYIAVMVLWWRSPLKRLPKILGILPLINGIYLPIRWLRDLKWGRFMLASIGLLLFAGGIVLILQGMYKYGAIAIAANWITAMSAAFLFREKKS